jgi:hypothetical protein
MTLNKVEQLEAQFYLMVRRVTLLEERLRLVQPLSDDVSQAGRIAVELNLDPVCLVRGDMLVERQRLSDALRTKGWNYPRIGRALGCCDRTAKRYANYYRRRMDLATATAKKQPRLRGI